MATSRLQVPTVDFGVWYCSSDTVHDSFEAYLLSNTEDELTAKGGDYIIRSAPVMSEVIFGRAISHVMVEDLMWGADLL